MFYYKLTQLCKKNNIPITSLMENLGMSSGNVSKWKNGNTPKMDTLKKIADYFHVSTDYFYGAEKSDDTLLRSVGAISLGKLCKIPILGAIKAGFPMFAQEQIEGFEYTEVTNPQDYFYLKVEGDSMINAGIRPGSLVLIRKQTTAENGQIVVCLLESEQATLKRFKKTGDMVALLSENPSYEPILLSYASFEEESSKILGVAVEVKTKLS